MNREEIEELKEFTIDLTNIDELALGLEICSKKSNMVIQELIDTIVQLQQENKKYKEVIDKIKTRYIDYYGTTKEVNDDYVLRSVLKDISDLLKEVNNMICGFGLGCLLVLVVISLC